MIMRCTVLLLTVGIILAQPLDQGTVPNDEFTAAPAPAPLDSEGWRTGRSTFFDGSESFKNAYLARYLLCLLCLHSALRLYLRCLCLLVIANVFAV